ncbi:MAG: hypothetical protein KGS72_22285 [Cyanobacteria bacterium REEB67]|nr:hypothetical protein [Cyanobacteria bacterium REEB67]
MSGQPAGHIEPIHEGGDKGGDKGLAGNFNVADLGGIFKATANMFSGAQDTLNKAFGPVGDLLPFTDHGASKGS